MGGGESEGRRPDALFSSTERESAPLRASQTLRKEVCIAGASPLGCSGPADHRNTSAQCVTRYRGHGTLPVASFHPEDWKVVSIQYGMGSYLTLNLTWPVGSVFLIILDSSDSKCVYNVGAVTVAHVNL